MNNSEAEYLNQTLCAPIEDLALVETHIRMISSTHMLEDVAILIDEGVKAILVLMLHGNQVVSMMRICLSVEKSTEAVNKLRSDKGKILFGSYQGVVLTEKDIHSISRINEIWNNITEQIAVISLDDVQEFFQRIERNSNKTGRGKSFSSNTKRQVMHDSHGRCMFTGCGQNLGFEGLTGSEGNFSYLAHNVASSEQGERGVVVLSEKLSDDPKNILLLCDKHHRLIDKVAAADYTAHRLSKMRQDFSETAALLLDGLSYTPIPVYSVLWPVHREVISAPSEAQIAQSLAPIRCRIGSRLNDVSDNEAILREADTEVAQQILLHSIQLTASRILSQLHSFRYTAALFAFGLMPPLIALGALLGNKNHITPMLRFRDSGQWVWPEEKPRDEFYTVTGLSELSDNESEVLLILALTAEPKSLVHARDEVAEAIGAKHVVIKAIPEYMGNGALGHPEEGRAFTSSMQKLLHQLRNKHGIERIHLLPCASNAACVCFGQAYDSHHPDIIVYDFAECSMKPFLLITNNDNRCEVKAPA